jgi:hypothetical protein
MHTERAPVFAVPVAHDWIAKFGDWVRHPAGVEAPASKDAFGMRFGADPAPTPCESGAAHVDTWDADHDAGRLMAPAKRPSKRR